MKSNRSTHKLGMKMRLRRTPLRRFLTVLLVAFILLAAGTGWVAANNVLFYVSPSIHYGLPYYGTEVAFADWIYWSSITWNQYSATAVTFTNLQMGNGLSIASLTVTDLTNGNLTFSKLMEGDETRFAFTGEPQTISTAKLTLASKPSKVTVNDVEQEEGTSWVWNAEAMQLSISVTHASDVWVSLFWAGTPTPPPPDYGTFTNTLLWQYLLSGNLIGFIIACYTYTLGQVFFVFMTVLFTAPLYIRTKNLTVLGILWMLIGGVFIAAMPIVSPVAILLMIFGVAAVLYKLFQHVT